MKQIILTDNQYKLLLNLLNEVYDNRSNCSCNYIDERALKLFNPQELQDALNSIGKSYAKDQFKEWKLEKESNNVDGTWNDALKSGWGMDDITFIIYLIKSIKSNTTKIITAET